LGFLAFFNVAISGGDLVALVCLSIHLPLQARVRQYGRKLYWKVRN